VVGQEAVGLVARTKVLGDRVVPEDSMITADAAVLAGAAGREGSDQAVPAVRGALRF
jgi:hypothetical protein